MEPIFQYIDKNIQRNGKLGEDFSLDDYRTTDSKLLNFVDGAEDGIMLYHIDIETDNTFVEKIMKKIIKLKENNISKVYQEIEKLYKPNKEKPIKTLQNIDTILDNIRKNIKTLEISTILKLAITIIMKTYNIETMKLGIALFGLADISQIKEIAEMIEKLALCNEFTLYAINAIMSWDNANEVIFMLAKKVNGWGKIHLVNRLEATNTNIREWLITDGCFNKIDFGYLAKTVADKVDLIDVLHRDNINKEQLKGINNIMEGLLEDDGPFIAIEEENTTELFESYLEQFKKVMDDITFYHVPVLISSFIYNKKNKSEEEEYIFMKIGFLLESRKSVNTLKKEILTEKPERLKQAIEVISIDPNINLTSEVFYVFSKDPFNNYYAFSYLLKKEQYKEKAIELMENSYDFNSHYEGPEPILFSNDSYHTNLTFIIQILGTYPFTCNNIVVAGLMSKVMQSRRAALNTIKKWQKISNREIDKFPESIVEALKKLQETEIIKSYKEELNELLGLNEDLSNYVEPEIIIQDIKEEKDESLDIDLFSDDIDFLFAPQIVFRGKDYYKNNMIYSCIQANNKYIAYIQGSEFGKEYEVEIEIDGTIVKNMKCNCPYQDNCKHEYATLLWLRENLNKNIKEGKYEN